MRKNMTSPASDRVVLVGTGGAAMAALWRLCATGAHIRWYVDSADIGEEAVLAHALAGSSNDSTTWPPATASLDGANGIVIASGVRGQAHLAERTRASGVAVHFVGESGLSGPALAHIVSAEVAAAATRA